MEASGKPSRESPHPPAPPQGGVRISGITKQRRRYLAALFQFCGDPTPPRLALTERKAARKKRSGDSNAIPSMQDHYTPTTSECQYAGEKISAPNNASVKSAALPPPAATRAAAVVRFRWLYPRPLALRTGRHRSASPLFHTPRGARRASVGLPRYYSLLAPRLRSCGFSGWRGARRTK